MEQVFDSQSLKYPEHCSGTFPVVDVIEWLLDGDPSIRWQVMRDLTGEPESRVAAQRSRVAKEGWGAMLLSLQDDDGQWGGGAYSPKWTSTTYTLLQLRDLGVDPAAAHISEAVQLVHERVEMGKGPLAVLQLQGRDLHHRDGVGPGAPTTGWPARAAMPSWTGCSASSSKTGDGTAQR